MASLKSLKLRIGSVKSTQKITKALNMVAASKLRRAQSSAEAGRPYSSRLSETVNRLVARVQVSDSSPRLIRGTGKDDTHLIVVVTSDRGLAGAFNTNIIRAVRRKAQELTAEGKTVLFYIVGRKGRPAIQRVAPKAIIGQYDTSHMKAPAFVDARAITEDLVDRFNTSQFDAIHLAFSEFKSVLVQEPKIQQIFPVVATPVAEGDKARPLPPRSNMSRTKKRSWPICFRAILCAALSRAAGECRRLLRQPDDRHGQCHAQRGRHDQSPVDSV
jgi:F-type H+-transporting ATPase subunit gamma